MDNKVKVAICGYGNLGKGIEKEITKSKDMELVAILQGEILNLLIRHHLFRLSV